MGPITIKELRDFVNSLPAEFNEFTLVNGEEGKVADLVKAKPELAKQLKNIDSEYTYRLDKPIISMRVDEETLELCFFHDVETKPVIS